MSTVYYDDPDLINAYDDKIEAVTKDDVRRVARTYLQEANRTVVITVPRNKVAPAAAPSR